MGIFGALSTAITGLQAQSDSLEHISNNIANSQTTAYKRIDTRFSELVPDSPPTSRALGVVKSNTRTTNSVQGDIGNVDNATYVAINGDGFFIVGEREGILDGRPVFSNEDLYTRRGDFELDRFGNLVNGGGYYLKGLEIDQTSGNVTGNLPDTVNISTDFLPSQATTEIDYRLNLANFPNIANVDPLIPNSELLNPADFIDGDPTAAGTGIVTANDQATFLDSSLSGGTITVFDPAGQEANVQFRWAKIDSVAAGGTDTWNAFYLTDSTATGTSSSWINAGTNYVFGTNGQLSPPINSTTLTGVTINGVVLGTLTLDHGGKGVTQFASQSGAAQVTELSQNGFAAGELTGVSISDSGRIVGSYTNGRSVDLAQLTLASFNANSLLLNLDGGAYRQTQESGTPIIGALGTIVGSSLEASNTDIADEFTKLIVTQQAYAANARVISIADELLQEALNIVR